jgi:pimeloyl-ACP methyl ester carboxylesterase
MATFRDPATPAMVMADDRAFLRLMVEGSGMDAESADEVLARIRTVEDADAALAWYRAADPADAAGMGPVTVPTLYVWSTDDIALGRTAAELTGAEVDGPYRFEVLDGISHWIPEEAPDVLASLLLAHITAARRAD